MHFSNPASPTAHSTTQPHALKLPPLVPCAFLFYLFYFVFTKCMSLVLLQLLLRRRLLFTSWIFRTSSSRSLYLSPPVTFSGSFSPIYPLPSSESATTHVHTFTLHTCLECRLDTDVICEKSSSSVGGVLHPSVATLRFLISLNSSSA